MTLESKSVVSGTGYSFSHAQLQLELNRLKRLDPKGKSLSLKDFHGEFSRAHPEVQKKIHHLIWMASGCPKEANFGASLLQKEITIVTRSFPPLTGGPTGTILQQVEADLRLDFQLAAKQSGTAGTKSGGYFSSFIKTPASQTVATLTRNRVQFFQERQANIRHSKFQIQALFNAMHPVIQEQLRSTGFQPPFYGRGFHPGLHKILGAHYHRPSGRTTFRVFAPKAQKVELRLTAFKHVEHVLQMRKDAEGVWTLETEHAKPPRSYHFMVTGIQGGPPVRKIDPFSFQNLVHGRETRCGEHESQVFDIDIDFPWTDGAWMSARRARPNPGCQPMTIYEVYAPGWKKKPSGEILNWRELALDLGSYCKENGYNAVELFAMFSHPYELSLGYQITGYFAPNNDMGTWRDFQFLVNHMHHLGIRVFADWVPAHFAIDSFALAEFDGSALLENGDHPLWGTKIFDFGKQFTRDFLVSNADFLCDRLHLDGLRVDAVASILHLNFGRSDTDYARGYQKRLNRKGTEIDLEGKSFLRHLNAYVHRQYPGVLTMAEDSSSFPNLTRPLGQKGRDIRTGGLGFDFAWHMVFKYDSLEFWKMPVSQRPSNFNRFLCSIHGVDNGGDIRPRESHILSYSHDENACGVGTLLAQMAGCTPEEKFAGGRMALAWQIMRGGGPILDFMGNENLQSDAWDARLRQSVEDPRQRGKTPLNWEELDPKVNPAESHFHNGSRASRRDLNLLYLNSPGLQDQSMEGIRQAHADFHNGVLCLHRKGGAQQFACILNTSDRHFTEYVIPMPGQEEAPELDRLASASEVYNTDAKKYGGRGRTNGHVIILRDPGNGRATALKLCLPPLSAVMLEEKFS